MVRALLSRSLFSIETSSSKQRSQAIELNFEGQVSERFWRRQRQDADNTQCQSKAAKLGTVLIGNPNRVELKSRWRWGPQVLYRFSIDSDGPEEPGNGGDAQLGDLASWGRCRWLRRNL